MSYLFTIEQLAERGYSVSYNRDTNKWWWYCIPDSRGYSGTKEQVVAAASAHCRENYVPPRPNGVPERAEFRLPQKDDKYLSIDGFTNTASHNWVFNDVDKFNYRRWCWREEEPKAGDDWRVVPKECLPKAVRDELASPEKPKCVTDEICAISTITNEVWQETLADIGRRGPMLTRYYACAMIDGYLQELWSESKRRNPDHAKMRASLVQIAAQAVRAIHDAKGWEE